MVVWYAPRMCELGVIPKQVGEMVSGGVIPLLLALVRPPSLLAHFRCPPKVNSPYESNRFFQKWPIHDGIGRNSVCELGVISMCEVVVFPKQVGEMVSGGVIPLLLALVRPPSLLAGHLATSYEVRERERET